MCSVRWEVSISRTYHIVIIFLQENTKFDQSKGKSTTPETKPYITIKQECLNKDELAVLKRKMLIEFAKSSVQR